VIRLTCYAVSHFRVKIVRNTALEENMAYRNGRLMWPSETDFVIDAHHVDGRFDHEIGRFEFHNHAMTAFDGYKKALSHMTLRLRQGETNCCTYHPQLGNASLPMVLTFPVKNSC
jgi:hypothetical protein